MILDRAGNMGSDYALIASLWTFIETRLIINRMRAQPGTLSRREGYPFALQTMANIALASSIYHAAYSTLLRQRPVKDQLVARWGPRHKENLDEEQK